MSSTHLHTPVTFRTALSSVLLVGLAMTAACATEEELEPSDAALDGDSEINGIDSVAGTIPEPVAQLAVELLPSDVREQGYVIHYQAQGLEDGVERFRVGYGILDVTDGKIWADEIEGVTQIDYRRDRDEALVGQDGWSPVDSLTQAPLALQQMTVVKFWWNTNYSGSYYTLNTNVSNTGVFQFYVPNLANIGQNDVWSSFKTHDALCGQQCLVDGKAVDVHAVRVYENSYSGGNSLNWGDTDSDSSFANNYWGNNVNLGNIDNKISSFRAELAVYTPPPPDGDDACIWNGTEYPHGSGSTLGATCSGKFNGVCIGGISDGESCIAAGECYAFCDNGQWVPT